jgi:signal peptidase II
MLRLGLGLAVLVALADQAAKWWILAVMQPPRVIEVTPFFNLVLGLNKGISFGLFGDHDSGPWIFLALAAAIATGLVIWLHRVRRAWIGAAIGLILGGAVGNAVDRLRFGGVVDFLDFHISGWHWPAFNLADSAITVGAAMMLLDALFERRR